MKSFKLSKSAVMLFLALSAIVVSCKKKDTPTPVTPVTPVTPAKATRTELSLDSIFLYAKEIYYWNDALPTYETFNPRKYTTGATSLDNYNKEVFDISQLKINPATSRPYEYKTTTSAKYSGIQDLTTQNPVAFANTDRSDVDLLGNGNDVGLKIVAYSTSSTDANAYALFIQAVYQNSPAEKAGMVRSDRITKINGRTIGANFNNDVDFINTSFSAATLTLEGYKYGTTNANFNVTLNKIVYKSSPVYKSKVFTAGGKKIGYLAYARFSILENSKPDFDAAFTKFAADGVKDLIIDLRYNGGGYVATAKYLLNLIAPDNLNGKVIYTEHYNPLMQSGLAKILTNQPALDGNGKVQYYNGRIYTYADRDYSVAGNTAYFEKAGPLHNVANVVFLVTGATASASETLINSLKPYLNVSVVGVKTYGKPIGFFPVRIENRYDVYFSLFNVKNSVGFGDYFDGFTPDVVDSFDDALHDFGDPAENYLAKGLNILAPGAAVTGKQADAATMSIQGQTFKVSTLNARSVIDGNEFVGMIQTEFVRKK